jgi:hypothetical protein
VRRGKSGVPLKSPDLHWPHNLVRDGKSSEARWALVGRQKARRCQANHKEIALQRGAAGDGRCTLWYTERIKQLLTDLKVRFAGSAIRTLGIDHSVGANLLGLGLFCQEWMLREQLAPLTFANSLSANMFLRPFAIYQNVSVSLKRTVPPFAA